MSKIKNGRLDQYGAGPIEQQQSGTAGVEGVNGPSVSQFVVGPPLYVQGGPKNRTVF